MPLTFQSDHEEAGYIQSPQSPTEDASLGAESLLNYVLPIEFPCLADSIPLGETSDTKNQ